MYLDRERGRRVEFEEIERYVAALLQMWQLTPGPRIDDQLDELGKLLPSFLYEMCEDLPSLG